MKMIVITSIRESLETVTGIFEAAGVKVFSVSDVLGHKSEQDNYMMDNWFFGNSNQSTAALFFFSFTEAEKAHQTMKLVKAHNTNHPGAFPIRAFVLPVEACSY